MLEPWATLMKDLAIVMARRVGFEGVGAQGAKYSIRPIGEPARSGGSFAWLLLLLMLEEGVVGKTEERVAMEERLRMRRARMVDSWIVGIL